MTTATRERVQRVQQAVNHCGISGAAEKLDNVRGRVIDRAGEIIEGAYTGKDSGKAHKYEGVEIIALNIANIVYSQEAERLIGKSFKDPVIPKALQNIGRSIKEKQMSKEDVMEAVMDRAGVIVANSISGKGRGIVHPVAGIELLSTTIAKVILEEGADKVARDLSLNLGEIIDSSFLNRYTPEGKISKAQITNCAHEIAESTVYGSDHQPTGGIEPLATALAGEILEKGAKNIAKSMDFHLDELKSHALSRHISSC